MSTIRTIFKATTLSIALLGAAAVVTTVAMPDAAYAGNGNGKGGGSDNGKGKSDSANKGGKSDNARKSRGGGGIFGDLFRGKKKDSESRSVSRASKRQETSAKIQKKIEVSTSAPKPRGNQLAATLGVHPSELGALNAANASPQALQNASPNSRVGKIAIYAEEVREIAAIEMELSEAQDLLDAMEMPERTVAEIDVATELATTDKSSLQQKLSMLEADLAAAGGEDEAIEGEISAVKEAIGAKDEDLEALALERADAEIYEAAEADVDRLADDLAQQEADARSALEAAANKEVTDAVEEAVRAMLGLDVPVGDPEDELEPPVEELELTEAN